MAIVLKRLAGAFVVACGFSVAAATAQSPSFELTLGAKAFEPTELQVPAGQKIRLTVHNATGRVAEFESYDLNREKILPAGSSARLYIGPLEPGSYGFFNEFRSDVRGRIVVR